MEILSIGRLRDTDTERFRMAYKKRWLTIHLISTKIHL